MEVGGLYISFVQMFLMHFEKIVELTYYLGTLGKTHPQPCQIQIFTLSGTLNTFSFNRQRAKTNLAKYLIQAEQLFNFIKNEAFTNFIRTTHNPEYDPFCKDTIRAKIFKVVEERKQILFATFSFVTKSCTYFGSS